MNYRWGGNPLAGTRLLLKDIFEGLERVEGDV